MSIKRVDDGWFMAKLGNIEVLHMDMDALNEDSCSRYIEALARDIDERPNDERVGIVYLMHGNPRLSVLNGARRKAITDVLEQREAKLARTVAGYVMVCGDAVTRSVTKALFWFAPPPYPAKIVERVEDGMKFLAERLSGFDGGAFLREYRNAVGVARERMRLRASSRPV